MDSTRQTRTLNLERSEINRSNGYGNHQICLPMSEVEYEQFSSDRQFARTVIDEHLQKHPHLFPQAVRENGYWFDGHERESTKLPGVRLRRIRVRHTQTVYTIRPSAVLPSMAGRTDEVEKGLFLLSHDNPPEVVAYVCGKNPMFWYRLLARLGNNSLAGTTLGAANLPDHLVADEYHTTTNHRKVYLGVTAAQGVFLGLGLSPTADQSGLAEAYGDFHLEMRNLAPDYAPQSVNTDGWSATQAAWRTLFAGIAVILCFLHGFLKIRDRCRRKFADLKKQVWEVYHATTAKEFTQRMESLKTWVDQREFPATVLTYVNKLTALTERYAEAYEHPGCHRTSNLVDRLMNLLDRMVHSGRRLHGHLMSAESRLRGWALLINFRPFSVRHQSRREVCWHSAAERVQETSYHDNWLHNLYVSASLGGYRR